jgi:hypothetical protein
MSNSEKLNINKNIRASELIRHSRAISKGTFINKDGPAIGIPGARTHAICENKIPGVCIRVQD